KLAALSLLAWWGLLPFLVYLLLAFAITAWRLRWALAQPEIPISAWLCAPFVKRWMDLAVDFGRMRVLWQADEAR
ncbi:hypothetical protein D6833_00545, partial [Candidatus Parcubacteria bacterium]